MSIGDDGGDVPQSGLAGEVTVRTQQDGRGAQPAERGDDRERARTGAHQHADPVTVAHADADQALHHAVDAVLDLVLAVDAVAEEEADLLAVAPRLLVQQQPDADPGGRVE
jgi:hypothetical protein